MRHKREWEVYPVRNGLKDPDPEISKMTVQVAELSQHAVQLCRRLQAHVKDLKRLPVWTVSKPEI
jgi:hypothetical protein